MITIKNLEVRFDVEGDDDRQAFAKLFNEFIGKWASEAEARHVRERELKDERALGTTSKRA